MKFLFLLLIFATLQIGCAGSKPAEQRIAPSTGKVKGDFKQSITSATRAERSIDRVSISSDRIGTHIGRAQTLQERIDNKATVILRYWK